MAVNGTGGARRRRVLMITYLFPPGTEMGAQACAQIARYLPLYEWTPAVLTVHERYMAQTDARAAPAFPGPVIRTAVIPHPFIIYRRLKSRLGLAVEGTAGHGASAGSIGQRRSVRHWVLSLLGVPDAYTGWIPPAVISGMRAIRRYEVEHLFSSGPYWTSHLVCLALAWLSGLPWTAHFRDPWTGPRTEMQRFKPVSALSARMEATLERMVVRRADVVVCVTEEQTALLRHAYPHVPSGKFVTIPNGFDGAEWESVASEATGADPSDAGMFVITYTGTLYDRRNPRPLFRALKALIDAGAVARERVRIDLIGWCDAAEGRRVGETAAECGLAGSIRLMAPLGRADTLRRMARSDLLLLFAEGLTVQIPGKTYEYLRAGRPILALAPDGAVARLLRRTGGARVVDPADETGIATAVREAYRLWTEGRRLPAPDQALVAAFDRRVLAGRFAEAFVGASARSADRDHATERQLAVGPPD